MHYGNWAFSTNNKRTIEAVGNSKRLLGQRDGFSPIDVKQLNKVYKCKGYENVKVPPPKGIIATIFHLISQQSIKERTDKHRLFLFIRCHQNIRESTRDKLAFC